MFLPIKACRLLIQQEDVSMSSTTGRWRRANVVDDKGSVGSYQRSGPIGCSLGLEAWLDPVEYWTEDGEGLEGSIDVETNDDVGFS